MHTYRFDAISSTGERSDGHRIMCHNDKEALTLAGKMLPGYAMIEVWLAGKMIGSALLNSGVTDPDNLAETSL